MNSLDLFLSETCGEFPVLTEDQERALFLQLEAGGPDAEEARDRIVVSNVRLVVSIAKHYLGRGLEMADLVQEGHIGLIRAVDKFDVERGLKFSTFATYEIRHAIIRACENYGSTARIPVHRHQTLREIAQARHELYQDLGREPETEEIAEAVGIDVGDLNKLLSLTDVDSLDRDRGAGNDGEWTLADLIPGDEEPVEDIVADRSMMGDVLSCVEELPDRQKEVVSAVYVKGMSMAAFGRESGICRERVRQLRNRALQSLRMQMGAAR